MVGVIFDLDQTLIDSSIAESDRKNGNWAKVYTQIPRFKVYDGIEAVLNYLTENAIPIAIVTSSPSTYCSKVLNHWKIKADIKVCYHDTSRRKPDPAPILLALKQLKIAKENVFSIGDKKDDIIASNAAGVNSIACIWGLESESLLISAKPTFIAHTPLEIIKIINAKSANGSTTGIV